MTATLASSLYGRDAFGPQDTRLEQVHSVVGDIDTFLAPLADNVDHETRLNNLEEIVKRSARLAWTLFSQPCEFQIDWRDEGQGLVVYPGLLQVADENGKQMRQPRSFAKKEFATM